MILALTGAGAGLAILLAIAVFVLLLLNWVVYWTGRRFRAAPLRKRWLLFVVPILALMVCFPPMRRTGEWADEATGLPISVSHQADFDRYWYRYDLSYKWVGALGTQFEDQLGRVTVTIGDRGPYVLAGTRWVINWWYFCAQIVVLVLLLLPFLRARGGW